MNEGRLSAERNFKVGERLFFNYFYQARGPNPIQSFPNTRWIYLASDSKHATQARIVKDFKQIIAKDWKNNPQFAKAYSLMHDGDLGQWNTVFAYSEDGQQIIVTQKDLDDFRSGAVVIFVLVQIPYKDDGKWHYLRRCQFLVPPAVVPAVWHFCDSFNDSD